MTWPFAIFCGSLSLSLSLTRNGGSFVNCCPYNFSRRQVSHDHILPRRSPHRRLLARRVFFFVGEIVHAQNLFFFFRSLRLALQKRSEMRSLLLSVLLRRIETITIIKKIINLSTRECVTPIGAEYKRHIGLHSFYVCSFFPIGCRLQSSPLPFSTSRPRERRRGSTNPRKRQRHIFSIFFSLLSSRSS